MGRPPAMRCAVSRSDPSGPAASALFHVISTPLPVPRPPILRPRALSPPKRRSRGEGGRPARAQPAWRRPHVQLPGGWRSECAAGPSPSAALIARCSPRLRPLPAAGERAALEPEGGRPAPRLRSGGSAHTAGAAAAPHDLAPLPADVLHPKPAPYPLHPPPPTVLRWPASAAGTSHFDTTRHRTGPAGAASWRGARRRARRRGAHPRIRMRCDKPVHLQARTRGWAARGVRSCGDWEKGGAHRKGGRREGALKCKQVWGVKGDSRDGTGAFPRGTDAVVGRWVWGPGC